MRPTNEKLASDILKAGQREFLEHGYRGASLRGIAASLHVSTGAIYRYYKDKESIFNRLVSDPADGLLAEYRKQQETFFTQTLEAQLLGLYQVPKHASDWMMTFVYDHFSAFKLIVCCAQGTAYEHYIDTLIDMECESSRLMIERMKAASISIQEIDDPLIHILASSLFSGMFETVRHNMPRQAALAHMGILRDFYSAGWFRILGILR